MKNKLFLRKGRGILLLLALCFFLGGVSAPRPAQAAYPVFDQARFAFITTISAARVAGWLATDALLETILAIIAELIVVTRDYFDALDGAFAKASAARISSIKVLSRIETNAAQFLSDTGAENAMLEVLIEEKLKHVGGITEQLCKTVSSQGLTMTTEGFQKTIAASVIRSILNETIGNGPKYSYKELLSRCALKTFSDIDGASSNCVDNTTKGDDGRPLADADLLPFDENQVLEVPSYTKETVDGEEYPILNPQTTEEKFWVAGYYHCRELVGPKPEPLKKEYIRTPGGISVRATWNHCAAVQTALTSACANLLAFYTRPGDAAPSLVENQQIGYESVIASGVTLPNTFKISRGLSPYQALYSSLSVCKSPRYMTSQVNEGATEAEVMSAVTKCDLAWNAFNALHSRLKGAVTQASVSLAKAQECWKQGAEKK